MTKIIRITVLASMAPTLAYAAAGPTDYIPHPDWILFGLAMVFTAWLSAQAFDRPPITLADIPTNPKYMTRPSLYNFGKGLFVLLSLAIYALMVRYHSNLPQIIKAVNPDWYKPLKDVIEDKNPSYLLIIIIVSACFLLLLRIEKEWNFYLAFRDLIHSWVSIPYLTKRIVAQINDALHVPETEQAKLPNCRPDWRVHSADFSKNPESMDRAWAELAYLQSWILDQHSTGPATTFFSEESFAWGEINGQFDRLLSLIGPRKDGFPMTEHQSTQLMKDISAHRNKLARLIACYLVFMNSSRSALLVAGSKLGINLGPEASENPLRYSAIYIVALAMAVYFSVYFAAVAYDLFQAVPIERALMDQEPSYVWRWVFLAFGDYGIPVLGILALRYVVWQANPVREYSFAVAYAWIFLLAALLSTLGLSFMSELIGKYAHQWGQFLYVCQQELRWSIGPAMICVYINHYLDRQIDPARPNVERASEHPLLRTGYAFLFTFLVLATAIPSLPAIQQSNPQSAWDLSKVRFVAMATIFSVTITLTLVAQFALIKPKSKSHDPLSDKPDHPGPQLAAA
jgi:hypothetical protein